MDDKKIFLTLGLLLLVFVISIFISIQYFGASFSIYRITGHAINNTGTVKIFISGQNLSITIYSPQNTTYNFNASDEFFIALNVSTNFDVAPSYGWKYSLYDMRHDTYAEQNTFFNPNSSITAVRWENKLTVFAYSDAEGKWVNTSVVFYVNVSNSAPVLGYISNTILVCEDASLSYNFNATDVDEDDLVGDISPKNPFYLNSFSRIGNLSFYQIISGILKKSDVGTHEEEISVVDSYNAVDTKKTNITVIEINNPPVMVGLGAQTVWTRGANSTFYHQMDVNDIEDGTTNDSNLYFNLSWDGGENLFDINSTTGVMNFTPQESQIGVYYLTTCVTDNPLPIVPENISLCDPRSANAETVCDNFSLTITDENRAPQIINWTPFNSSLSTNGESKINFSVEVYDADGTIPDINWYINSNLKQHVENESNDSFLFSFGCGVSGVQKIMAITSDGLLEDSHIWNVSINPVTCLKLSSSGGGGGGGGGTPYCMENWACEDWRVCQNVKKSFDFKILSLNDYHTTKEICAQKGYRGKYCGIQTTICHDLNACNNSKPKIQEPSQTRICYFTKNPNCQDGIKNCHNGACELLVDCGGPCEDCPTCSDGKQNQGETDIDCGGPCPYVCPKKAPINTINNILIAFSILLILLILFILYRLLILFKKRRKNNEQNY